MVKHRFSAEVLLSLYDAFNSQSNRDNRSIASLVPAPLHSTATKKQHQTNHILVVGAVSRKVEVHVISILKVIGIFWLEAVVVVVVAMIQQWWRVMRRQAVVVVTIQSTRLDKSDDLPYHMLYGCIGSRVDIRKSHG